MNYDRLRKQFDVGGQQKKSSYLVIIEDQTVIHHEGDELSKNYPGHGYPAYTETIDGYRIYEFTDKVELEGWISRNSNLKFVIKSCTHVTFETKTHVELSV